MAVTGESHRSQQSRDCGASNGLHERAVGNDGQVALPHWKKVLKVVPPVLAI